MDRKTIVEAIDKERDRQEKLHPIPKRIKSKDEDVVIINEMIIATEFLAVLMEEVGEVAKALQGEGDLEDELIQVASVCFRWLENR